MLAIENAKLPPVIDPVDLIDEVKLRHQAPLNNGDGDDDDIVIPPANILWGNRLSGDRYGYSGGGYSGGGRQMGSYSRPSSRSTSRVGTPRGSGSGGGSAGRGSGSSSGSLLPSRGPSPVPSFMLELLGEGKGSRPSRTFLFGSHIMNEVAEGGEREGYGGESPMSRSNSRNRLTSSGTSSRVNLLGSGRGSRSGSDDNRSDPYKGPRGGDGGDGRGEYQGSGRYAQFMEKVKKEKEKLSRLRELEMRMVSRRQNKLLTLIPN